MKFIFSVLLPLIFFTNTGLAESLKENRAETQILTVVTVDDKDFDVMWTVWMIGNPVDEKLFSECKAEIRDKLILDVIRITEQARRIGRIQDSLKTPCHNQASIGYEAEPVLIHER